MNKNLSIIVPAHNEEDNLKELIETDYITRNFTKKIINNL